MTKRPTCKTCRFWAAPDREQQDSADCRIRAPLFVAGYSRAVWPASAPDDWCGEHVSLAAYEAHRVQMRALQERIGGALDRVDKLRKEMDDDGSDA